MRSLKKAMSPRQKRPTELVDMGKLMSLSGVQPISLSQITGPGSPRKFRVLPFEEVVLGRDEECEIILDEDPVSRKHAKLLYHGSQPELLDLGSTNGTFLNGKRVHRAFLTDSSRVQVGSSNFVVEAAKDVTIESPPDGSVTPNGLASLLQKSKNRSTPSPQQASAISGRLSELRLPSLLQMIESDRATGTLVILHGGQEGKLHIHQGVVRHASLDRASGLKALYRLMALDEGGFEFYIPGRNPGFDTVAGDMQKHLLEAMRQKDELAVYKKRLPSPEVRLTLNGDKVIPVHKVPAPYFEVMAAVRRHQTVDRVIEHCPIPDFEVCHILLVLLQHEIVQMAPAEPTS